MWFLAGFITLAVFCLSSLFWRSRIYWRGKKRQADGIDYEIKLTLDKKQEHVTRVEVGVACGDGISFTLTRERLHDVVAKQVGLIEECQTGDPAFDDTVYIRSDDRVVHRMLQTDRVLRESLLQLIDACPYGLKSVEVYQGRLWMAAKPIGETPEDAEQECARLAPLLNRAAARLLEPTTPATPETQYPFPFRANCIRAISTGLGIRGFFSLFPLYPPPFPFMLNPLAPWIIAVPIGLCVFALLALAALAWLRRSARTHLVLIELFLVGMPGAMLNAYEMAHDFNIDRDRTSPSLSLATVTDLDIDPGGRNTPTRYRVELQGWPTEAARTWLNVESRDYYELQIGSSVAVEQHPGAFGWAWVSGIQLR